MLWRDELNVEHEEFLIDFILRWVDHDEKRSAQLVNLMKCLRYPLMNFDFIEGKFRTHPRWKGNKSMQKLVKTIYKGCFQIFNRITNDPCPSLKCLKVRYRLPSQVIFLYGGWNRGRTLDATECYNTKTGFWYSAGHLKDETEGRSYFGIEYIDNEVYVIGKVHTIHKKLIKKTFKISLKIANNIHIKLRLHITKMAVLCSLRNHRFSSLIENCRCLVVIHIE